MNGNSFRGNAKGITLDSLNNLECKSDISKYDFLMYIVE